MTLNMKCGTPTFSWNVTDEYRRCKDLIPAILKYLGAKPSDIISTSRDWRLKVTGGSDLNLSKSLNENGFHIHQLQAGAGTSVTGVSNPNSNGVAVSLAIELYDSKGAYEPPLQTIPLKAFA